MGQAVSLNSCVAGGSVVHVMRADGQFEDYEFPTSAAEVMIQHPGHLVVHCASVGKNSLGQRPKITIILPEQPLMPGQPYMMYPIPENHKKSLARSKSFSLLRKGYGDPQTDASGSPVEKRKGRRNALKLVLTRLHLATFVASTIAEQSDEPLRRPVIEGLPVPRLPENGRTVPSAPSKVHAAPAEESKQTDRGRQEEEEEEEDHDSLTLQLPKPSELNFAWRPMLSTIPESPLGFHSNPQSPLGLYKMDSFPASRFSVSANRAPSFVAAR